MPKIIFDIPQDMLENILTDEAYMLIFLHHVKKRLETYAQESKDNG